MDFFVCWKNSFNKTEAAFFPMQAMLLEDFLFFSFELLLMQ